MNASSPVMSRAQFLQGSKFEAFPPIRVSLVEDKDSLREDLVRLLSQEPLFTLVASLSDGLEATQHLPKVETDVVLMDIGLPIIDGIECVRRLRTQMPNTEFLMLTVFDDNERILAALAAGATGYLVKSAPWETLKESIVDLHLGGSPISSSIARKIINHFVQTTPQAPETQNSPQNGEITLREMEVLRALSRGWRYKEIAKNLEISPHTVRAHVHSIYRKLQVHSRTQVVEEFRKLRATRAIRSQTRP